MRPTDRERDRDEEIDDKSRRQKRFKQKRNFRQKENLQKDFPNRVEQRSHRRRNRIEWQGGDFDYQEEYGNE